MQGYYNYIVKVEERYLNETEEGLIVNTEISERDYMFVNRIGTIVATPLLEIYDSIEPGDEVIVHHNVFRTYYDIRGNLKNGSAFLEDNLFKVEPELIYAYRKPGQYWKAIDGFCFVEPINDDSKWGQGEKSLQGTLVIDNEETKKLGLKIGDVVGFTSDSEYEFTIEGDRMYRVHTQSLNLLYHECEGKKTTNNQELSQSA